MIGLRFLKKLVGRPLARRSRALARAFLENTARADEIQRDLLLSMIRRNRESEFGRDHGFSEIRTIDDYRKRVPIRGYDGHEPYIAKVREGRLDALFGPGAEVLMFAKTSGTTAQPKTIPVTRESLEAYRAGWRIWGILAFDAHPEILAAGLKPIVQFAGDWRESETSAGIPCGAITGLTAHMQNRIVRSTYCLPPNIGRVKDVRAKYHLALRLALPKDVGTLIAANPATVLALARHADREKESLIREIRDGTLDPGLEIPDEVRAHVRRKLAKKRPELAKHLEKLVEKRGALLPRDYWPELNFLSNWTGGTMGAYLKDFPDWFGEKPVRDVGLIASEGRMTVPVEDNTTSGVLDYIHHFFEFLPEDRIDDPDPETLLGHELVEGERYFILPTTSGGLHRYQIFDLVRCDGHLGKAPLLTFLNKGAHFSSMTGEKLSEFQVVGAVRDAQRELGAHWSSFLLLPVWGDPPNYALLVEVSDLRRAGDPLEKVADAVDRHLRAWNDEYDNRRETRRLGPVEIHPVADDTWSQLQARRLARSGGTLEQYKKPCLLSDLDQIAEFPRVALREQPSPAAGD